FLIVWDFIKYAKEQGIPVGPGRGSAAGSLVAYSMAITDVDPLEYELLFERFLNPERVSMPDIDIDFCVRGRGKVIDYVSEFYGRESVSQIITFGTMASRAAIKDVGRALEMPYADVEKIAKLIPPPVRGRNVSIDQAIEQVPELKKAIQENSDVAELITIAKKLEGCARHSSVHAAGVVISPKPLDELVPVYKSNKDELTTQYPMSDLEKTGMLKMDFLALTTLTIIEDALKTIEQEQGYPLDINDIPLQDEKTMRLFAEGKCDGIFQFESGGMVEICRKLRPEGIEDLAALNALYRPGPLDSGMIDEFVERRHGRRKVKYDFPELKEVLGNTLGVIVYQEQIMAMFQKLADYSLGEADLVRRAMGKKKREELDKHKERFLERAVAKGHDPGKLEKLWHSIEGFADYAFNRSHSVAYAWVAYQTAYLKANYPTHFWAAVMSNEIDNTTKIAKYITEAHGTGIEILSPDVNISQYNFTPTRSAIRFGLGAIKGIGQSAVSSVIAAREQGGPFKSIFDFAERVDSKAVNKRVMESMIKSGAFDGFGAKRSQLFLSIDKAIDGGARAQRDRESGQVGLFGMIEAEVSTAANELLPDVEEWTLEQKLSGEKETLGFYVSGHPLKKYEHALNDFCDTVIAGLGEKQDKSQVSVGGTITSVQQKTTKKGDRFALLQVEDMTESVKVVVWPETYKRTSGLFQNDTAVIVKGKLDVEDEGVYSIIADDIFALDGIYEKMARGITICAEASLLEADSADKLFELLDGNRGSAEVAIKLTLEDETEVTISPAQLVTVKLSPELSSQIKKLNPAFSVELILPKTNGNRRERESGGSERSAYAARVPRVSADDTRTWWDVN
ncbi:MAG TPA: DNA polymerase III subunit alpha, partial [Blastocatellia bacterium]|nr:DNA polymerase III subunit alpha [Blastocatellia bacterium]